MGYPKSIIDLSFFDEKKCEEVFQFTDGLVEERFYPRTFFGALGVAFLEPSTRTRMSFEYAASRAGLQILNLGDEKQSSMSKGETIEDTLFTMAAMRPRALVIRAGEDLALGELAFELEKKFSVPVVNGGWGKKSHPTQALLDYYTIRQKLGRFQKFKFLFVGDTKHSRVFNSHLELARMLSVEVAICSPAAFSAEEASGEDIRKFENLDEALGWADAVMMLRYQRERHGSEEFSAEDFHASHGLTKARLRSAENIRAILHPGPFERGLEIAADVLDDSRSLIWKQVQNGVLIREALLRIVTGVGM